jgi:hypothetical protein
MKLKVKNVDLNCIQRNTKALLMSRERRMYVIDEIVIEEFDEIHKPLLGKPRNVKVQYITKAVVMGYNHKGRFLGSMNDDGAEMFLLNHDHDIMRNNWREFRVELEAFGFSVEHIKKAEDTAVLKAELNAQREELAKEFAKLGAQAFNEETGVDYQDQQ